MTNDQSLPPALRAESNLLRSLEIWAQACPTGVLEQGDGWTVACSREPMRSFNNLIIHDDRADLGHALAVVRRLAPEGRFRIRLREGLACLDDDIAPALGLRRQGGIPSLVLDLAQPPGGVALEDAPWREPSPGNAVQRSPSDVARPSPVVPSATEVHAVEDNTSLIDHVAVVAGAFDWDPAQLARVFARRILEDTRWRGYVAYVDGQPAASSQLVVGEGGDAGIYYVGTLAERRNRGLGRATTARAVADALGRGCDQVSLQASPMGLPIYTAMGFRQVAYYRQYVPA